MTARELIAKFCEVRKAGDYNKMLRELRKALADNVLRPLDVLLVEGLEEQCMNPNRGETRAFSDAELIARWPTFFPPRQDDPLHFDRRTGLLGFFNKAVGLGRPSSLQGTTCPKENRLGDKAVNGRVGALKRYLFRVVGHFGQEDTKDLANCFSSEALQWWLPSYLAEREVITSMHRDEFLEITYTAELYFGADTSEVDAIADEIDFPAVGESMRGSEVLRAGGTPRILLDWADCFAAFAAATRKPTPNSPTGLYYPRKCLEIDVLLRLDTGLRPENIDTLEFLESAPPPGYYRPAIWWDAAAECYMISIPRDCMKQHKRSLGRSNRDNKANRGARRPYVFKVWRKRTVDVLREYLSYWRMTRGMVSEGDRGLFLDREGNAYKPSAFGNSFIAKKHVAAREWKRATGIKLPILDRYAHRHLMGEFLRRHIPGGNLKTWYLTHRSDKGSDGSYGDDDAQFLRDCIDEILEGKPSRPEQERARWCEHQAQLDTMMNQMTSLNNNVSAISEELRHANQQLKERDRTIEQLRAQLTNLTRRNAA